MAKMVKYALIGATVGAGYSAVQAYRRDEPVDVLASQAAKVAGEAAAAGAVIGLLVGRRAKKKAGRKGGGQLGRKGLKLAASAEAAGLVGKAGKAGKRARKQAAKKAEQGRRAARMARKGAKVTAAKEGVKLSTVPIRAVHDAAEAARPIAERAAEVARDRAIDMADAA